MFIPFYKNRFKIYKIFLETHDLTLQIHNLFHYYPNNIYFVIHVVISPRNQTLEITKNM